MQDPAKIALSGEDVFTVRKFLSPQDCKDLIEKSESMGYEAATVNTSGGHHLMLDLRNNTRVILDDAAAAARLWEKARKFVPETIEGRHAVGINERLRFYRYEPGQQFDWHTDGYYRRDNGEQSCLTFMVYLNGGFSGGETSFDEAPVPNKPPDFQVVPEAGMALFFKHMLVHKGGPVAEGRKYVLRSDVMFSA